MKNILYKIVSNNILHAKWLNTLSLMENTGARKISASEHPLRVTEMILKHAAEEARHAYYLKKQISKVSPGACPDYTFKNLLTPLTSYHYLNILDTKAARYVKSELDLKENDLAYACYLLVTYAIEMRADELYPVYQTVLDETASKVNVKSIIAEEEGHLEEMVKQLETFSSEWKRHANYVCALEKKLFDEWKAQLANLESPREKWEDQNPKVLQDQYNKDF